MNSDEIQTQTSHIKRQNRVAWVPPWYRSRLLTHDIYPENSKGLEFGALTNPVLTREHTDIRFVDYLTTSELKERPFEPTVKKEKIVAVDYVWSGSGSLAEVIGTGETFDFAIASHVIEHVPNILGWFRGIYDVLRPGGAFNLAVPDKRFTFDIKREPSTLGELVEADLLGYTRPSARQIFDHTYEARAIGPGDIWRTNASPDTLPRYSQVALQLAYDQAVRSLEQSRYYDAHCWVFTPLTFLSLLVGATKLNRFPFIVSSFSSTVRGDFEFFIMLRKGSTSALQPTLRAEQLWALRVVRQRAEVSERQLALAMGLPQPGDSK